jgi:hypothetical protein
MNIEEGKEQLDGMETSLIRYPFSYFRIINNHGKWVPLITAWRVLRLQIEELPPLWRITADILNKHLADSLQEMVL